VHDLVARTNFARHHGYQVTLELGEGIGMMLEQWCWLLDEMKSISLHYTRVDTTYMEVWKKENPGLDLPPESIPVDLLLPRLARRGYVKVDMLLSMLYVISPFSTVQQQHQTDFEHSMQAIFDMAVHNPESHEALLQLDEVQLYKNIYVEVLSKPFPDQSNMHVSRGYLLAGYDAGLYAYVW